MARVFRCGRFEWQLERPLVMGILNVTPDSFSDGGRFQHVDHALVQAERLIQEGADIIDIGGESTRPGAPAVSVAEELDRVLPVIEALITSGVPLSIDTSKAEVMRAAVTAGIDMVNDIAALGDAGAIEAVANSSVGICLMHMQGDPQTMQASPRYDSVLGDVLTWLAQRKQTICAAGIAPERVVLDPGFGFGKSFEHNAELFRHLSAFLALNSPLLIGVSRKSMLGHILGGVPAAQRDWATVASSIMAAQKGASIIRVHAVEPTVHALKVLHALQ
ncbi:dihydropteroate synthase [Burkholderiaceae bacterium DAT-1]|nr:dihydropteroate synthase [Burkholderiaceae bacterium DAT-1]